MIKDWISYRALAIWEGGINGIETQSEFLQHLQIMTTAMENPPTIKFLPLEEGKKVKLFLTRRWRILCSSRKRV